MRKGLLYAVVILMLAVVLQACGNNNNDADQGTDGNGNEQTAGEQVTLRVWGDLGNQDVLEEPFKKINEAFEAKHENIKLQFDFAQNDQSLNVALQANELPDLFTVQGDKTPKMKQMVDNGFLLDLTPYNLDQSRYAESEIAYATVDGKIYSAFPSFSDTQLVYFNKTIFEENNVEVPTTWDELITVLETLKDSGITPIALGGKSEWDRAWPMYTFGSALANDALQAIVDGTGTLTDPSISEALQAYRDFAENGYFGRDFLAMDNTAAQLAFTNGKAAMIIDGTWNNPTYESANLELGRFFIPNKAGETIVPASYSNFMTFAVSSKAQHPDEAVKYIEFLNSQEAQQIMEDINGLVPTIKDIEPRDEGIEELMAFDAAGSNIYSVMALLATEASNVPDIFMKETLPKLLTLEITGEEGTAALHEVAEYPEQ